MVFFVDTGSGIWRLDRNGSLTRIAGPAFHWMTIDEERRFAQTRWPSLPDAELRPAGGNPALLLSSDFPVAIGRDGAFYYPERKGDNRVEIVRLMPSGSRSVLVALPLPWLNGMAVGPDGSIYYTENTAVRRVTPQGRVITVAGGIRLALCARIPGIGPELGADLRGLAVTPNGTVYVAASGCGAVLKIDGRGQVTPIAQTASPWSPTSVAVSGDVLYILEYLHTASDDRRQWTPRIRKVLPNGRATIVAAIRR